MIRSPWGLNNIAFLNIVHLISNLLPLRLLPYRLSHMATEVVLRPSSRTVLFCYWGAHGSSAGSFAVNTGEMKWLSLHIPFDKAFLHGRLDDQLFQAARAYPVIIYSCFIHTFRRTNKSPLSPITALDRNLEVQTLEACQVDLLGMVEDQSQVEVRNLAAEQHPKVESAADAVMGVD